jgi:hypothetical protein
MIKIIKKYELYEDFKGSSVFMGTIKFNAKGECEFDSTDSEFIVLSEKQLTLIVKKMKGLREGDVE